MNKKDSPSNNTIVYWLIQDKNIDPENLFNFLDFFWPNFIEKNNYIFLKDKYSEEEFIRLNEENSDPEYWINLVMVDDFFSNTAKGEAKAERLARSLVEIWQAKLKKDFPNKMFVVQHIWDKEYGDCGLTFYQTK